MNIVNVIIGALILFTLLAIGFYYKGWMESIITGKTVAILTLMTGGALAIKYFTSRAIAKSGIVSKAHSMALQQTENFQDDTQEFQPPPQYNPPPLPLQATRIPQRPRPQATRIPQRPRLPSPRRGRRSPRRGRRSPRRGGRDMTFGTTEGLLSSGLF